VTVPIVPAYSTSSLHEGTHATVGAKTAKVRWECDTKTCMRLVHEIAHDESGKVDFAWSEPDSSTLWGMLPRKSSLICAPPSGYFPMRRLIARRPFLKMDH
jgi:hypothetical protein